MNNYLLCALAFIFIFSESNASTKAKPRWAQIENIDELEKELDQEMNMSPGGSKPDALNPMIEPSQPSGEAKAQKPPSTGTDDEIEQLMQSIESDMKPKDEPKQSASAKEPAPVEKKPEEPILLEEAPLSMIPQSAELSDDAPNSKYEKQLHDIYLNYFQKKLTNQEWMAIAGDRYTELYEIQRGDTLWDISQTFFGDGHYWPKIWSLNEKIENPHLISKGNSIQFFLGNESEAPAFTVVESSQVVEEFKEPTVKELEKEPESSSVQIESGQEITEVALPPPETPPVPVIKRLPPSFPEWSRSSPDFSEFGISFEQRKISQVKDVTPLPTYVTEKLPFILGEVKEFDSGREAAIQGDYLYVTVDVGTVAEGDKLMVIETKGLVRPPHMRMPTTAQMIQLLGQIQILQKVQINNPDRNMKGEVYKAYVMQSVLPILKKSQLIKGELPTIDISESGIEADVPAQIIGGSLSNVRYVMSGAQIVFLDKGSKGGMKPGLVLPIIENPIVRSDDSVIKSREGFIGRVKVVQSTEQYSTAIILSSVKEVMSGDYVGSAP